MDEQTPLPDIPVPAASLPEAPVLDAPMPDTAPIRPGPPLVSRNRAAPANVPDGLFPITYLGQQVQGFYGVAWEPGQTQNLTNKAAYLHLRAKALFRLAAGYTGPAPTAG